MIQKILISALLFACAAFGYWFHQHFEFYQDTKDLGWSAKARANDFLAAEQYLEKLQFKASSSGKLNDFEALTANDSLLLADSSMILSERQLQKILTWVNTGGHLIVGAAYTDSDVESEEGTETDHSDDLLLQRLGLSHERDSCDCEKGIHGDFSENIDQENFQNPPEHEGPQDAEIASDDNKDTSIQADDSPEPDSLSKSDAEKTFSQIMREHNQKIRDINKGIKPPDSNKKDTIQKNADTHVGEVINHDDSEPYSYDPTELTITRWDNYDGDVQLHFDEHGYLDHDFFYEPDPDEEDLTENTIEPVYWRGNDHGAQLVQFEWGEGLISVVSQTDIWHSYSLDELDHALQLWLLVNGSEQVLILYGTQMPGLLVLLWKYAAELLMASLVLLGFWLWHRAVRFGQPVPVLVIERRSMIEHIHACADLLWRGKHGNVLLEPLRVDTRRLFIQKNPALASNFNDSQLYAAMAKHCDLTDIAIQYAFECVADNREREFQTCVITLQKIRKAL